jgi:hypothetical protein
LKHPIVPIIAGDVYTHDFVFPSAGATWSATILDSHYVAIAGVAVVVTIVSPTEARIRFQMAATETLKLKGIKYAPIIRLRDDTLGQTRMEWQIEVR